MYRYECFDMDGEPLGVVESENGALHENDTVPLNNRLYTVKSRRLMGNRLQLILQEPE